MQRKARHLASYSKYKASGNIGTTEEKCKLFSLLNSPHSRKDSFS